MPRKKNGIGYLRRSSHKQIENNSIEVQKQMILDRALDESYIIVKWLYDDAVSAFSKSASQRPALVQLLETVTKERIDGMFFYEESRIDRQLDSFVIEIYNQIKANKHQFKFFSTNHSGEWNPEDPIIQHKLLMSYNESLIKSQRAIDSQTSMLNDHRRPGAKTPYGYDSTNHSLIANEDACIVLFIFYLSSWGYSHENIQVVLNKYNIPSPSGKRWSASTINHILTNYSYAGHLSWNVRERANNRKRKPVDESVLFKNNHEPIVPEHLWFLVEQSTSLKNTCGKFDSPFYLRDILTCSLCSTKLKTKDMTPAKSSKKYLYYYCPTCKKKVNAKFINSIILEKLSKDIGQQTQQIQNKIDKLLNSWNKLLDKTKKELEAEKELIIYNEKMVRSRTTNTSNKDHLLLVYDSANKHIDQKLQRVMKAIESIKFLQNSKDERQQIFDRFGRLNLSNLNQVELRTVTLMLLNKIEVNFQINEYDLSIDYRLNPFVDLENEITQINEND